MDEDMLPEPLDQAFNRIQLLAPTPHVFDDPIINTDLGVVPQSVGRILPNRLIKKGFSLLPSYRLGHYLIF